MGVGESGRSAPKHTVIDKLVGQQAGAYPHVQRRNRMTGFTVIDPTAGDGADPRSTPALLRRHCEHVESKGHAATHLMFERDPATFDALTAAGFEAINSDAIMEVPRLERFERDALTYIDDPNHSGASTLTTEVLEWLFEGEFVTVFASIGANANGIARKAEHYEESFQRYSDLLRLSEQAWPFRREVVLCRLDGDAHRWGYIVVVSAKFFEPVRQWFARAMTEVPVQHGGRTIYLRGRVVVGFADALTELTAMHKRRMADPFDPDVQRLTPDEVEKHQRGGR